MVRPLKRLNVVNLFSIILSFFEPPPSGLVHFYGIRSQPGSVGRKEDGSERDPRPEEGGEHVQDDAGLSRAHHSLTGQKGNMNVQSRTIEIKI